MSAPPLPEAFGNYALGEFAEVAAPAGVSWLPQTAGWAWLGLALLLLLLHWGWRRLQHWYRNRYRREALARLQELVAEPAAGELVPRLNKLLKITAMAAYSREAVASLYGEEWACFLNRQCPAAPFSPEQGRLLASGSYRPASLDSAEGRALLEAGRAWIREHLETVDA